MKTRVLLIILVPGLIANVFGQRQSLDLTFTAVDNAAYVQLDSCKIMNRTRETDTTLFWPDTTLTMEMTAGDGLLYVGYIKGLPVGVRKLNQEKDQFQLFQNYPNPVKDQSVISLYIPGKGAVNIIVADVQGRAIITNDWQIDKGTHAFRFTPGNNNLYFLTAWWTGESRSIKILNTLQNNGIRCTLTYIGNIDKEITLKASRRKSDMTMLESGIIDAPLANETYTFQFATNIPCPGTPTVTYEGQVYNTIQIFDQCWLKENLNVGTMIPGNQGMADNGILEKYCYDNKEDSCTKYGGLYQWEEMMQYTVQQRVQGICPPGWHLPSDEEWKVMEGAVDSQYGIGDCIWDTVDSRGFDAGFDLKSTTGWNFEGSGMDLFGFSAYPGGYRLNSGFFIAIGDYGNWWIASENNSISAWYRFLSCYYPEVIRNCYNKSCGFSVRCLKDN